MTSQVYFPSTALQLLDNLSNIDVAFGEVDDEVWDEYRYLGETCQVLLLSEKHYIEIHDPSFRCTLYPVEFTFKDWPLVMRKFGF